MATKEDYSGRTVDYLIFQGTAPTGEEQIYLGFGTAGEITTGIQKLVQSFTIFFLTELGSIPIFPEKGTRFLTAVKQGKIRDESDVQAEFGLAMQLLKQFFDLEADAVSPPDDEVLVSAVLSSFSINKVTSKLVLFVKITSAAGATRDIFLPIPIAIR